MKENRKSLETVLPKALDYSEYREMIQGLLAEKKTTGSNQSEDMVFYTELNEQRMHRWDKRAELSEETLAVVKGLPSKQLWIVITEGWCGDAAHIVPVLAKMADATPMIDMKVVLRDEHPEFMDRHLTNGGKSIPKLVVLDADSLEQLWEWGPRPKPAQEKVLAFKALPEPPPYMEFVKELQIWYTRDKAKTIQQEIVEGIKSFAVAE